MTIKPSLKNLFVITLLAVIGILILKFGATKLPFVPAGVKSTVAAV